MTNKRSTKAHQILRLKGDAPYLGRRRIAAALGMPEKFVRSVLKQYDKETVTSSKLTSEFKLSRDVRSVIRLKKDAPYLGRRRIAKALGIPEKRVRKILESFDESHSGSLPVCKPERCAKCGRLITMVPCLVCDEKKLALDRPGPPRAKKAT